MLKRANVGKAKFAYHHSWIRGLLILLPLFLAFLLSSTAFAKPDDDVLDMFSRNDIFYYDPSNCPPGPGSNDTVGAKPSGDEVTWIGDSYSVGAQSIIKSKLSGVDIHAKSSKKIEGTFTDKNGLNESGMKVLENLGKTGVRKYLVFALGTNQDSPAADIVKDVKEIMSNYMANDGHLILVTPWILKGSSNYEALGKKMEQAAALDEYKGRVHVADWAEIGKQHTNYYGSDQIHLTQEGYRVWVDLIYDTLPGGGTLSGNTNEERVWNYLASAGISGFSDNAAAIAGVMGNIHVETGGTFNPYAHSDGKNYYGIVQWGYYYKGKRTHAADMIDKVTALGDYWGKTPPADINTKALQIELDYLLQESADFQTFVQDLGKTDSTSGEAGAASYSDLFIVEVERAVGGSSTLIDSYARKKASSSHYQAAAERRKYAQEHFKTYSNKVGVSSSSSSSTITISNSGSTSSSGSTGDFSAVLTAKNADKSFFNGSGDVPSAEWTDSNKDSMKTLLETYGDLAYQLGRATGAPYVAILVQMRYEDPNSRCGKNNFWGNGCPPHTPVGGAKIQGANLGEGFKQYGETLLKPIHHRAVGVSDPKRYLEVLGPTWVQGDPNGAGYALIGSMKKSVDALQNYINTPEGQAIVQTFGNYTATPGGGDVCGGGGNYSATPGEAAGIPVNERMRWLFDNSAPPTSSSGMQSWLTTIEVPVYDENGTQTTKRLTVHKKLAAEFTAILQDLYNANFRIRSRDTAAYNWKNISGTSKLSRHSIGAAIDVNWEANPNYTNTSNTSVYQPNTTAPLKINDSIVRIFKAHGFFWGGCFSNKIDIMHFDYFDKGSATSRYTVCGEQ